MKKTTCLPLKIKEVPLHQIKVSFLKRKKNKGLQMKVQCSPRWESAESTPTFLKEKIKKIKKENYLFYLSNIFTSLAVPSRL